MRTTVNLDEDLLGRAKVLAATNHRTIGSVLEEALRDHLDRLSEVPAARAVLPTFSPADPRLRSGVDLEDRHGVADLLDGLHGRDGSERESRTHAPS